MASDTELKTMQAKEIEQDWRLDPQRVILQAVIAIAAIAGAVIGAVASIAGYFIGRAH